MSTKFTASLSPSPSTSTKASIERKTIKISKRMNAYVFNESDSNLLIKGSIASLSINGSNNKILIRSSVPTLIINGEGNSIKATYYQNSLCDIIFNNDNNKKLYTFEHLIMAKEGTEAGNYYNQSAINFLSTSITTTTKLKKYPVIATIKKYLHNMSSDFFESSIPKENIIVGEVTIDNIKKNKLYIDGYNKDIILKSINIDSLGFSSFLGRSYQPSYCLYIVDNVDKLPIKKTKSELKIEGDKPYYIFVLIVDISGELEDPNIIPKVDTRIDFVFTLEGSRKINKKETEINPNRYDCYYSSIKDGLFSLCISIKPEDISLKSTVPIFNNYENGLLTYYYIGTESEDEIDLDV